MQAIAQDLRNRPEDFIEPANHGIVSANDIRTIAKEIDTIARNLADPDLRSFIRERGRLATTALLSSACQSQQHDQDWVKKFKELIE